MEVTNFARSYQQYAERGVGVLGISTDSIESHKRFAEKLSVPFPLLADIDGRMCHDYGVERKTSKGDLRARRVTMLIDEDGRVEKIWDPVSAEIHNEQVLNYLGTSAERGIRRSQGQWSPPPQP